MLEMERTLLMNMQEKIDALDTKDVLGSTRMFPEQCEQIWKDGKEVEFPEDYKNKSNIIFAGMGGSAYGGYVIQALFGDELKVPIVSRNNYGLPGFVDENSLVIAASYSGTTEETVNALESGVSRGASVTGLTCGGEVKEILSECESPFIKVNPVKNPSGQPRLATGYMVLGSIALLNSGEYIKVDDEEVESAIVSLKENSSNIESRAKEIAEKLYGFQPVIVGAEFLAGNCHIMRNQFNETAKLDSEFNEIPEINHHQMEGLKNPEEKKQCFVFLNSDLYSSDINLRLELTKEVVKKNGVNFVEFDPYGETKLQQVLSTLSFGGFLSFYLGIMYGEDPSLIPYVDFFKTELSNRRD